jgi:hypothetical protein
MVLISILRHKTFLVRNVVLELRAEMFDEGAHGHGGCIA